MLKTKNNDLEILITAIADDVKDGKTTNELLGHIQKHINELDRKKK